MRHRAWILLAVGLLVGVACTRATLQAVHQENKVVQLAQEMAASTSQVSPSCHHSAIELILSKY